ncbi:hypothetical protein WNY51_07540 [Pseudocolwellia sp. AS88]|uniref:hypothetical protein n=1 Tax=Pseudocolwellia sp. AS88 TaxID=3063958 RepID=UPI0026EB1FD1|nr:hypothetical protein [Pseudocolwellia sp. AS88]MDO7086648.1 hypothetical protein [Pseudocolwellia sp. AS88]
MFQQFIKTTVTLLTLSCLPTLANESTTFGVSLGTPAFANFVIKSDKFGLPLQLSGGYWGDRASGIEVGYSFYQNKDSFFHSAQVITGYLHMEKNRYENNRWSYVGVSTTFKNGGFFLEPGLTFGSGTYSNPQLMIQIGWLWDL